MTHVQTHIHMYIHMGFNPTRLNAGALPEIHVYTHTRKLIDKCENENCCEHRAVLYVQGLMYMYKIISVCVHVCVCVCMCNG